MQSQQSNQPTAEEKHTKNRDRQIHRKLNISVFIHVSSNKPTVNNILIYYCYYLFECEKKQTDKRNEQKKNWIVQKYIYEYDNCNVSISK